MLQLPRRDQRNHLYSEGTAWCSCDARHRKSDPSIWGAAHVSGDPGVPLWQEQRRACGVPAALPCPMLCSLHAIGVASSAVCSVPSSVASVCPCPIPSLPLAWPAVQAGATVLVFQMLKWILYNRGLILS